MECLEDEDWVRDNLRSSDVIEDHRVAHGLPEGLRSGPSIQETKMTGTKRTLAEIDDFTIEHQTSWRIYRKRNREEGSGEDEEDLL